MVRMTSADTTQSMAEPYTVLVATLALRVVFPLGGPRKPPGRRSPKNGEKLQNSPPRSDPRKWGKIAPKKG